MELMVRGTPVSPGLAVGRVLRMAEHVRSSDPGVGSVYVTAAASPGLCSQDPKPVAIVAERGGALAALGTIARELGVVAVFAAAGAQALLRDGELVLVDGQSGLVYRIDEQELDRDYSLQVPSP